MPSRHFHIAGQIPLSPDSLEIDPADLATLDNRVQVGGPDECWPYIAKPFVGMPVDDTPRYFTVYVRPPDGGRKIRMTAHRVALVRACGPIDPNLEACHSCDNPSCCNPRHLRADTSAGNAADARRPTSIARARMLYATAHERTLDWLARVREHQAELERQRRAPAAVVAPRRPRPLPPRRQLVEVRP